MTSGGTFFIFVASPIWFDAKKNTPLRGRIQIHTPCLIQTPNNNKAGSGFVSISSTFFKI